MCCLQGQGHGDVGGGVRMSGGICVCVYEGNHHSHHQCAHPASISAVTPRPSSHPAALGGGSLAAHGERVSERQVLIPSQEALSEQNHQSKSSFSLSFRFLSFYFIVLLQMPAVQSRKSNVWHLWCSCVDSDSDDQRKQWIINFCGENVTVRWLCV